MVRVLLRFEGLAVLGLSVYGYATIGAAWLWYIVLFLTPDLSKVGYIANARVGSITYNIVHAYVLSASLLATGWAFLWLRDSSWPGTSAWTGSSGTV
jgi:Domain of unknown function (DUF4260)